MDKPMAFSVCLHLLLAAAAVASIPKPVLTMATPISDKDTEKLSDTEKRLLYAQTIRDEIMPKFYADTGAARYEVDLILQVESDLRLLETIKDAEHDRNLIPLIEMLRDDVDLLDAKDQELQKDHTI